MSKKPSTSDVTALTFEQAMTQLEDIIRRIESGEVGLEQSIAEYERGVALVKRCESVLGQAEQRVKEVSGELLASRAKVERPNKADSADDDEPLADEED